MVWVRLATAIIVFLAACGGLGYLAGLLIRRRKWRDWVLPVAVIAIAFVGPVMVVTYTIYDARRYQRQPHDDAPGIIVYSPIFAAPFLFVASIPPTVIGAFIGRCRSRKA